ncbi:hypothetical protein GF314_00355 [bacterium]|nr:hypothetical protein [bacterium]
MRGRILGLLLLTVPATLAVAIPPLASTASPPGDRTRTVAGDLCDTALPLGRGESAEVDLCLAWDDYDPGSFSCSNCELPGPDVVFFLDTQAGEQLRITASTDDAGADVRLYLATDCADPAGTCLVASDGASAPIDHTVVQGGTVYLFVDTTDACSTVTVGLDGAASTSRSTWGALKAIYR